MRSQTLTLRIGHSPDPDDAFMFYALARGAEQEEGLAIEHVMADIQSLNERALRAELEVTAASAAAYPALADRYWIMRSGASMGRGYGPIVVAKNPITERDWSKTLVATPGLHTTANLLLSLHHPEVQRVVVPFEEIPFAVLDGRVQAGVLIHEGQLTYDAMGLCKIEDYGVAWEEETGGLPLPLGLDLVRKDLGRECAERISSLLRRSIAHALANEDDALTYALEFGRGIDRQVGREFVRMYVNEDTLDMGDEGVAALRHLYGLAVRRGLLDRIPDLELV
jgi:1,4-dihydroxy-6-naphthoate synthase